MHAENVPMVTISRAAVTYDEIQGYGGSEGNDAFVEPNWHPKKMFARLLSWFSMSSILSSFLSVFHCSQWLKNYKVKEFLLPDILSGFSCAVVHVPQGMVCAILAGVTPVYGLYTSFFPAIIYAIFGTSPHVSLGTYPVIALMTLSSVNRYSSEDVEGRSPLDIAVALTFTSGITQLIFWICQVHRLSSLFSPSLAEGFTFGSAILVAISQLPLVFDVKKESYSGPLASVKSLIDVFSRMPGAVIASIITAACSALFIIALKFYLAPKLKKRTRIPIPVDLILVCVVTGISYGIDLNKRFGSTLVGDIPSGFPIPKVPHASTLELVALDGVAVGLVQFASTYSLADVMARKRGYTISAKQEMLAYGLCSVFSGFFLCLPSGSAIARSLIIDDIGGRTQMSGIVSSVFLATVLLVLAPALEPLPVCVLGIIIILALKDIYIKIFRVPQLWRICRIDAVIWMITFIAVVLLDVIYGLIAGVLVCVGTTFWRLNTYKGHRLMQKEEDIFLQETDSRKMNAGLVVYRFGSPLCFANCSNFRSEIHELLNSLKRKSVPGSKSEIKNTLILDCSGISFIDSAGLDTLSEVVSRCTKEECTVYLAALPSDVLKQVQKREFLLFLTHSFIVPTIQDALSLAKWKATTRNSVQESTTFISEISDSGPNEQAL